MNDQARQGADDLEKLIADRVAEWALVYPLANWPTWSGFVADDDRDRLIAMARKIAATWGSLIAEAVQDIVQPRLAAERAAADRRCREAVTGALNAAADKLDALPAGGEALQGPYWYRNGVGDAANCLRDWADLPSIVAFLGLDEQTPGPAGQTDEASGRGADDPR